MSRTKKLLSEPRAFFRDALSKRYPALSLNPSIAAARSSGKPTAILVGFSNWKSWMREILSDHYVVYLGYTPKVAPALIKRITEFPKPHVFAWSYKHPPDLPDFCERHGIRLTFVEDGFLRSVGLGTLKSRPMSLLFDDSAMHFDRARLSNLDRLLNSYDFAMNPAALATARRVMAALRQGVSKYVSVGTGQSLRTELGLAPDERCILVLGQVEDDLSLKHGMMGFMSGNDLVTKVAVANPGATILYRPHPESIAVRKKHYSDPQDVANLCHVLDGRWSLKDTLDVASEAHVITSLAGLEAKVAGLTVHTYGMPFYAGWGFTIDHGLSSVPGKRTRTLSLEEVIAGAYVLYPRYFHPVDSHSITVDDALVILSNLRDHMIRVTQAKSNLEPASQ